MGTARLGPLLRICCFKLLIATAYVAARGAVAAASTQTWGQNNFELLPEAQIYVQNKDNLRRLGNVTVNTAVIGAPQKWSQFSLPLVPVDAASLRLDVSPGMAYTRVTCRVTCRTLQGQGQARLVHDCTYLSGIWTWTRSDCMLCRVGLGQCGDTGRTRCRETYRAAHSL